MKINEKNLLSFALTRPVDLDGYLLFKKEGKFQKRFFVLKGNLLFYFEKKGDKELLGLLLLEGCTVELSSDESQPYCFQLTFITPGENRSYYLAADNQQQLEIWMKAITCASYEYVKIMVTELQRQLEEIDNRNKNQLIKKETTLPERPPRQRQNPFNKPQTASHSSTITTTAEITKPSIFMPTEFLETIKDDESCLENLQQEIGRALKEDMRADQKLTVT
ncbi:hypothetical protein PVAND_010219 [Polypedilum vanderplanki]|uniref:PH domain-containing protein n=1 Tax=Polypedilum vanderplanki TaxID=319348 RepID=A0A9J6CEW8_POLVA|nr:hypothetical protein PVAND_010219 [Polypedilum vanderplanki]